MKAKRLAMRFVCMLITCLFRMPLPVGGNTFMIGMKLLFKLSEYSYGSLLRCFQGFAVHVVPVDWSSPLHPSTFSCTAVDFDAWSKLQPDLFIYFTPVHKCYCWPFMKTFWWGGMPFFFCCVREWLCALLLPVTCLRGLFSVCSRVPVGETRPTASANSASRTRGETPWWMKRSCQKVCNFDHLLLCLIVAYFFQPSVL